MSEEIIFIEELGKCQFTMEEVEIILERKMTKLEKQKHKKGQLLAEYEVRQTIVKMSKQGSTPAIQEFLKLIEKREKLES
ncbi:MAG TPA: hypothetical protein PLD55_04320 [bacterium]|nr:hypothetical protein [bacterium]